MRGRKAPTKKAFWESRLPWWLSSATSTGPVARATGVSTSCHSG